MNLKVFCDGGARGNPGPAAIGVIIKSKIDEERTIWRFGRKIPQSTNNTAEYKALIEALKHIKLSVVSCQWSVERIDFYLDSKLAVNQLNGLFKLKNPKLRELVWQIRNLEQEIPVSIFYHFIPREKNLAHHLVDQAFRSL